jgi:hypothetical protein
VKADSGLGDIVEDECQVDPRTFAAFTDRLVDWYQRTNNEALRSLIEGFTSIALVLLDRMGVEAASIKPEYADMWATERRRQAKVRASVMGHTASACRRSSADRPRRYEPDLKMQSGKSPVACGRSATTRTTASSPRTALMGTCRACRAGNGLRRTRCRRRTGYDD